MLSSLPHWDGTRLRGSGRVDSRHTATAQRVEWMRRTGSWTSARVLWVNYVAG